jgi:aminopeptidase N
MRRLACFLLFISLVPALRSEEKFKFESTPGKLPKTIAPHEYVIFLDPKISNRTIAGSEQIEIEVLRPTDRIVLNAVDSEITNAMITADSFKQTFEPAFQPENQTVSFQTSTLLQPGTYHLSFTFKSKIQQQPKGLFLRHYRSGNEERTLLASQLEPSDARRLFPCWDEPIFRATYQWNVLVDSGSQAISNMPVSMEQKLGPKKLISFQVSPSMASYLVALVVGHFEWLEDTVSGVRVRVITAGGQKESGRYALTVAKQILPYYNEYFGTDYPLPKLDNIALPNGFGGAMENWGAITYSEQLVLFDSTEDSEHGKRKIFLTMAHEIAHQWFGNLVTLSWWNNLWLNEGFASWMEQKAAAHFHPEWKPWLAAELEKQKAMELDARQTTHAIEQPVESEDAIEDAFDEITYVKAATVIRMLESYLGETGFRDGVRTYLRDRKYSNATSEDFWDALDRAGGRNVRAMAAQWVEQPGFPLVKMTAQCVGDKRVVSLEQAQFTLDASPSSTATWPTPIGIFSSPGSNAKYAVLAKISDNFEMASCDGAIKANAAGVGFFRVLYEPALAIELQKNVTQLPEADRVNLVADAWAMVSSGRSPMISYCELLDELRNDPSANLWRIILDSLTALDRLEQGQPRREAFQSYITTLLTPSFDRLGWTEKPDESYDDQQLRPLLIEALGVFGSRAVIDESFRLFQEFQKNGAAISPNLRSAILKVVGRYSSEVVYEELHRAALATENLGDKQRYYQALQAALDPKLARRTLEIAMTDEMPLSVAEQTFEKVAEEGEHAGLVWQFVKENLKSLLASRAHFRKDSFLPSVAENFSDETHATELVELVKRIGNSPALHQAENSAELIKARSFLKEKQIPLIDAWIDQRIALTH